MALEMKYFILKPRAKSKDDQYAIASQEAMLRYADVILSYDPVLSKNLTEWAEKEETRQAWME